MKAVSVRTADKNRTHLTHNCIVGATSQDILQNLLSPGGKEGITQSGAVGAVASSASRKKLHQRRGGEQIHVVEIGVFKGSLPKAWHRSQGSIRWQQQFADDTALTEVKVLVGETSICDFAWQLVLK